MKNKNYLRFAIAILFLSLVGSAVFAQTPPEFTYQGSLKDGANAANGNYDFEIKLYNASTGGAPIGTRTRLNVPVTNGVFIVKLDFAGAAFNGDDRFLEIGVRLAGGGGYQQLLPRQQINHVPYSIRSVQANQADTATTATDALSLGGIAANQYVLTGDARLSDARPPTGGSTFYIQNNPLLQQAANFNINGNGIVGGNLTVDGTLNANLPAGDGSYIQNRTSQQTGIVNFNIQGSGTVGGTFHATGAINTFQYNLAGNRVLTAEGDNLFVGWGAGTNSAGSSNTFVGHNAGGTMGIFGSYNSFFGFSAGRLSNNSSNNSFFGYLAGEKTMGGFNAFFGALAGDDNTTGSSNSFFGSYAGTANTGGSRNAFFGTEAGYSNLNGDDNSFFGVSAGMNNTGGNRNSFFGRDAGRSNVGGIGNAFYGFEAGKNSTANFNTLFGSQAGNSNTTGERNVFVGNSAGTANLQGDRNAFFGTNAGDLNTSGFQNVFVGTNAGNTNTTGDNNTIIGAGADVGSSNLSYATAIGAGTVVTNSNTVVVGRSSDVVVVPGRLAFYEHVGGSGELCWEFLEGNSNYRLVALCASSLRYKTDVQTFTGGLDVVRRLRPITFNWKKSREHDLGFAAEEVAEIEPLLATYNKDGQVEGVKYGQITTVLVNAVNEQQAQIEAQGAQIERQRAEVEALKALVCAQNPTAGMCRPKE